MNTIFMNSGNSKASDPINMLLYQILAYTIDRKIQKSHTKIINLKYQLQLGMINLSYSMDYVLQQIFKIILSIFQKNTIEKRQIILQ